ncbi:MAG: hypothetical protein QM724_02305 [Flavobacteriales bacterium]
MHRTVLLLLLGVMLRSAAAQTVVYPAYEQYVQHRGDTLGDFVEAYPVLGRFVLVFGKDDGQERVHSRRIWGFTYNGVLFRIREADSMPVRLMAKGAICYYENGLAHLEMQRDHVEQAFFNDGERSYLSKDLQSEIVPAHFTEGDRRILQRAVPAGTSGIQHRMRLHRRPRGHGPHAAVRGGLRSGGRGQALSSRA